MKPAQFRYIPARSAAEALSLLKEYGEDARLLAGGQSLVPLMNLRMARPLVLVDLGRCSDLAYIEERGDCIAYGPMTRQMDAQRSKITDSQCRLVGQALSLAGPVAIRNRATVGGTLAHADRTAELPGVTVALDATFVIDGPAGRREVPAANFFVADLTTDVKPGEMLSEIKIPKIPAGTFSIFVEAGVRSRDMALAGVAACLSFDASGRCASARLAVIGVEPTPVRLHDIEAMLVSCSIDQRTAREAGAKARGLVNPLTDVHATETYRRHLVGTLVERALLQATER